MPAALYVPRWVRTMSASSGKVDPRKLVAIFFIAILLPSLAAGCVEEDEGDGNGNGGGSVTISLKQPFMESRSTGSENVWDASMDMIVNIALGRGSDEQRMVFLQGILAQQKEIIANFGPYNPLVSLEQYRDTLSEITKLSGYMDPSKFFKEVSQEEVAAFMQQQSQQKQQAPDPATILAQVEAEKIKADIVISAAKQELERQKAAAQADMDRDKLYVDAMLRAAEIEAKYNTQVDMALIKGEVDRQRAEIQQMFRTAQAPAPTDFGGIQ